MTWEYQVVVTAIIVALVELVEHWFPWRLVLRRDLPRLAAYILGVAGIALPYTALLMMWWQTWDGGYPLPVGVFIPVSEAVRRCLVAFWYAVGAGGLAVAVAYAIDQVLLLAVKAQDLEEIATLCRKTVD